MVISQSNICRSALNSPNICDRLHLAWSLFIQGAFEHLGFGHIELDCVVYEYNYLKGQECKPNWEQYQEKKYRKCTFYFFIFYSLGQNEEI